MDMFRQVLDMCEYPDLDSGQLARGQGLIHSHSGQTLNLGKGAARLPATFRSCRLTMLVRGLNCLAVPAQVYFGK